MTGIASPGSKMPRSILFMCGMNAIRSPMAEALAKAALPKGTYVASAGVRHGERDPFVDVVLDEVGLTIGRHQPHTLDELEDDYFDVIVTLAPEAHHKALELTRSMAVDVVYWPTPDPTVATGTRDQIVGAYRAVRDHLAGLIASRLAGREKVG
ncbi:low molecular weight phosphatase family protein [Sinorhizobium fredii]|uniref:arsenate-mycothiol transferase ArsC n=1 Tax=Rhizobium fredii TaxID=380 RepID=UPI0005638D93|nr:low molecular weight phosphatase family protein [Sinorhizobium fredii]WOS63310.1 low molecular weight phosphatase family protein [Sinorhizobium fredii GR64]